MKHYAPHVRNIERFPEDLMFQLTADEASHLRSQTVTLKSGRGLHRKYSPYAFTEQGVSMLSSVLRSGRAIYVNIEIMRAFVRLRQMLASNAELFRKLVALEKKYDTQFKAVFDAIRELMTPSDPKKNVLLVLRRGRKSDADPFCCGCFPEDLMFQLAAEEFAEQHRNGA